MGLGVVEDKGGAGGAVEVEGDAAEGGGRLEQLLLEDAEAPTLPIRWLRSHYIINFHPTHPSTPASFLPF